MSLTPLDIQKMRFPQKMRGYDPTEVEDFLALVAEELATRLSQVDKLERENRYYRQRLEEAEEREHQLQQTLLRAQKVSDEITANARREAELTGQGGRDDGRQDRAAGDRAVHPLRRQDRGAAHHAARAAAQVQEHASTSSSASWRPRWRTSARPPPSSPCPRKKEA